MNDKYIEKSKSLKKYHYSNLPSQIQTYLHDTLVQMLKVVLPIFEKNDIRYSLCGGSLLGAVLIQKMLPWDGDVDICILEDDYEKALELLKSNLPNWMMLQWTDSEKNYYHGWAKVRDKNSCIHPGVNAYKNNGVWIDLYKMAKVKKCQTSYLIFKEHYDYLNRRYLVGDISKSELDKRIEKNDLINKMNETKQYAEQSLDSTYVYMVWSLPIIQIELEACFPRKKYSFEGLNVFGFKDAESYLSKHYSEKWRELPPENQRLIGFEMLEILNSSSQTL